MGHVLTEVWFRSFSFLFMGDLYWFVGSSRSSNPGVSSFVVALPPLVASCRSDLVLKPDESEWSQSRSLSGSPGESVVQLACCFLKFTRGEVVIFGIIRIWAWTMVTMLISRRFWMILVNFSPRGRCFEASTNRWTLHTTGFARIWMMLFKGITHWWLLIDDQLDSRPCQVPHSSRVANIPQPCGISDGHPSS